MKKLFQYYIYSLYQIIGGVLICLIPYCFTLKIFDLGIVCLICGFSCGLYGTYKLRKIGECKI